MMRPIFVCGVLLASGALMLGSSRAPAGEDAVPGPAQAVTYSVATGKTTVRPARTSEAKAATFGPRRRAGRLGVSDRVDDETAPRPEKVFGTDDRFAIADTTAFPWATVCKVVSTFPDGTAVTGSAVLISERFALTAGHVIHDRGFGGFAETVTVVPAYDHGDAPFGEFTAVDITSFVGFTRDRDYDWDFALLELDGTPGATAGFLGLAAYDDPYLQGLTVNTAGFPSDLDDGQAMYGASGPIGQVLAGQLRMRGTMDAVRGQSGSGVWELLDDDRYVVGVVSTETSTWNQATRITGAVFDAFVEWIDLADAPDLAITAVDALLPDEFELPRSANVTVRIANEGRTSGTAELSLFARNLLGQRTELASQVVTVAAADEFAVLLPVDFAATFAGGTTDLEAVVNDEGTLVERDYGDNILYGPRVVLLPPHVTIPVGLPARTALGPGGLVRQQFEVPAGLRRLRLSLVGPVGGVVTVTRPDGTQLRLRAGRAVRVEPLPGIWETDLRAPARLRRARTFTFRAVPKY
jgi:V8-like Glu-specific endopeptidase